MRPIQIIRKKEKYRSRPHNYLFNNIRQNVLIIIGAILGLFFTYGLVIKLFLEQGAIMGETLVIIGLSICCVLCILLHIFDYRTKYRDDSTMDHERFQALYSEYCELRKKLGL